MIQHILSFTEKCLTSEYKRHEGFSLEEMLNGLEKIAVNQENKIAVSKIYSDYVCFTLVQCFIII